MWNEFASSTGSFTLFGLTTGARGEKVQERQTRVSGANMRIVGSFAVLTSLASSAFFCASAQAPAGRKLPTLQGIVVDDAKAPIANAQLSLKPYGEALRVTRSGTDGHFSFESVPQGAGSITIKRIGYKLRTVPVDIAALDNPSLELALETIAEDLDPVTVEGGTGRMAEFKDHRQNSSFGHFFDQADIHRINPRFVSELFRSVPGATIEVASGIGNHVYLRGCKPRIFVNGVRTVNAEIDEVAAPSEVDGIEIYPSMAGTPAQYMDRENRACGTVIIWSRR
ncbi:MAG: carboxypeptidase regulatory-like domain-containing protein [Gemmatimonadaceae bacterium]